MGKFMPDKINSKLISMAIQGIVKAEAKLLNVRLSGPYPCEKLKRKLRKIFSGCYWSNPNYRHSYIIWEKNYYLKIFCDPLDGFWPACSITVIPRDALSPRRYKKLLMGLDKQLPGLTLSSVDFGVDLFCDFQEQVERLFQVIVQNLFVPCKMEPTKMLCKDLVVEGEKDRSNRVRRIGSCRRVLERGLDQKKGQYESWSYSDLDRFRLEYTSKGMVLRERGLASLEDLIDDPQFPSIIAGKWKFKQFTFNRLPKPFAYKTKGCDAQCFLPIYHIARKHIPNICKHTEEIPEFSVLEERIMNEAVRFNDQWKRM